MRNIRGAAVLGAIFILLLGGCAHQLEVKNLRAYQSAEISPLEQQVTIGIIPSTEDPESLRLMKGIGLALKKHTATVVLPYAPGSTRPVDVTAKISIQPEYVGSGWNFLINFPGFLVWAPVWNGYVYHVNYDIDILLSRESDNSKIDSWSIPVRLNIRHADINRTWTEISWLEAGVIALVSGFVFIGYDDNVTGLVVEKIEGPLGDFIAQEIINRLNNSGTLPVQQKLYEPPPSENRLAPPAATALIPSGAVALPVPSPPPVAKFAPGEIARAMPNAHLRSRPTPEGSSTAVLDSGASVVLRSELKNTKGTWWYAEAGGQQGWIQETDLQPKLP